jgi:hypothetical protein
VVKKDDRRGRRIYTPTVTTVIVESWEEYVWVSTRQWLTALSMLDMKFKRPSRAYKKSKINGKNCTSN